VVQRVRPGFEAQYRQWSGRINSACSEFPGFVDLEVFEPGPGDNCFVIVIHFDTDEHGLAWQSSAVCVELLKSAQPFLTVAAVHPPASTFGGWFSAPGSGKSPSRRWKEALTVLFVLYPTVLSVAILTWILMPLVNRKLSFWLTPMGSSDRDTLKGAAIMLGGGVLMILLFQLLAP
jgi:antibiotic biosynthesis monooxygenase (ABM) superfamily enzyme